MNLNLATLAVSFAISLGLHLALVSAIIWNVGSGTGGNLDSSAITVEIVGQRQGDQAYSSLLEKPASKPEEINHTQEVSKVSLASVAVKPAKLKPQSMPNKPLASSRLGNSSAGAGLGLPGQGLSGAVTTTLLSAPKPPFPTLARKAGFEGSVTFDLTIDAQGHVKDAKVFKSSGRQDCDLSAQKTILERWRFSELVGASDTLEWQQRVIVKYALED